MDVESPSTGTGSMNVESPVLGSWVAGALEFDGCAWHRHHLCFACLRFHLGAWLDRAARVATWLLRTYIRMRD
jgi:hypothetical protein